MGLFDQFPYTNFHELNLAWILEALKEIQTTTEQFVAINSLKYADPIQWNITSQYEKNTIVIDPQSGTAYISVAPVPLGVALTNEDYWTVVFDLGSFVTRAAQNFTDKWEESTTLTATFDSGVNDWLIWGDRLYRVLSPIVAGDQYVIGSNIEHFTLESIIGHIEDLTTTDKSNLVAAINEVLTTLANTTGDLADLDTTDKSNLVAAINEVADQVLGKIGDLEDLETTAKDTLVNAINENVTNILALDNSTHLYANLKDYGAVGDGVTDNTAALQAALSDTNYNGLIIPPGTYLITNYVYLTRSNYNVVGCGGVIKVNGTNNAAVAFYCAAENQHNVSIEGVIFEGTRGDDTPASNREHGIIFRSTQAGASYSFSCKHCTFINLMGYSLGFDGLTDSQTLTPQFLAYDIIVENCYMYNCLKLSMSGVSARIVNNYIVGSYLEHITVDNDCRFCVIANNIMRFARGGAGAIAVDSSRHIIITNNVIDNGMLDRTYPYLINFLSSGTTACRFINLSDNQLLNNKDGVAIHVGIPANVPFILESTNITDNVYNNVASGAYDFEAPTQIETTVISNENYTPGVPHNIPVGFFTLGHHNKSDIVSNRDISSWFESIFSTVALATMTFNQSCATFTARCTLNTDVAIGDTLFTIPSTIPVNYTQYLYTGAIKVSGTDISPFAVTVNTDGTVKSLFTAANGDSLRFSFSLPLTPA